MRAPSAAIAVAVAVFLPLLIGAKPQRGRKATPRRPGRAVSVPADRLITRRSVGLVKTGMTLAQAQAKVPGSRLKRFFDSEGIPWVSLTLGGRELMDLFAAEEQEEVDPSATIFTIQVFDPRFKTAAGVHPGMAVRDVERRYGRLKQIEWDELRGWEFAQFRNAPPGLTLRVEASDGNEAGVYPRDARPPATSTRYNPTARVLSITITL